MTDGDDDGDALFGNLERDGAGCIVDHTKAADGDHHTPVLVSSSSSKSSKDSSLGSVLDGSLVESCIVIDCQCEYRSISPLLGRLTMIRKQCDLWQLQRPLQTTHVKELPAVRLRSEKVIERPASQHVPQRSLLERLERVDAIGMGLADELRRHEAVAEECYDAPVARGRVDRGGEGVIQVQGAVRGEEGEGPHGTADDEGSGGGGGLV